MVYATERPERYANLKVFCEEKGLSYNTYSRKPFPIKYKKYYVHKVCLVSGDFDECVFDIVINQFKSLEGVGCITDKKPHSLTINNNFIKSIDLSAHFDGKKYKIKSVDLNMKKISE